MGSHSAKSRLHSRNSVLRTVGCRCGVVKVHSGLLGWILVVACAICVGGLLLLLSPGRADRSEIPHPPGVSRGIDKLAAPSPRDAPAANPIDPVPYRSECNVRPVVLRGAVVDAGGIPLARVRIDSKPLAGGGSGSVATTESGADGTFLLELRSPLGHRLSFSLAGYRTAWRDVHIVSGAFVHVMERAPGLTGRAIDRLGTPVPGASVAWSDWNAPGGRKGLEHTNLDGTFVVSDAPMHLDLVVDAQGFPVHHERRTLAREVDFEVTVVLAEARTIQVLILDGDTAGPIARASVSHWRYMGTRDASSTFTGVARQVEQALTGENGRCRLERLPPVEQPSLIRPRGFFWIVADGYAPVWHQIPSEKGLEFATVSLYRTAVARGRVVDASGRGIPGVTVYAESSIQMLCVGDDPLYRVRDQQFLFAASSRQIAPPAAPFHAARIATTDGDGRYAVADIPASRGGSLAKAMIPGGRATAEVQVHPGSASEFPDMVWEQERVLLRVAGTVQDPEANPIPGASVRLWGTAGTTDSAGRFELLASRAQGGLTAFVSAPGFARAAVQIAEGSIDGLVVTLSRGAVVPVQVRGRNGVALQGARVQAHAASGDSSGPLGLSLAAAVTDDRGFAALVSLPPQFDLSVAYPPGRGAHSLSVRGLEADGRPVVVDLPDVDARFGLGTLLVDVLDAKTRTRVDEPVQIEVEAPCGSRVMPPLAAPVRIPDLKWGSLKLRVSRPGAMTVEHAVDLESAESEVSIVVGRGSSVIGHVGGAGEPLPRPLRVLVEPSSGLPTWVPVGPDMSFQVEGMPRGSARFSIPLRAKAGLGLEEAQAYATRSPSEVRIANPVETVALSVVPCAILEIRSVIPAPGNPAQLSGEAAGVSRGDIRYRVTDSVGAVLYDGRPTLATAASAAVFLNLPAEGTYQAEVWRGGRLQDRAIVTAGSRWRHTLPAP